MDLSAAVQELGSEVVVGCPALSKGQLKQRATAGAIGGLAGMAIASRFKKAKSEDTAPGGHVGSIYITLGTDKIAFFEQKNGLTSSLGRLLAVHNIAAVSVQEWKPAKFGISKLTLTAAEETYEFDVALVQKSKAAKVVEAVQAAMAKAA